MKIENEKNEEVKDVTVDDAKSIASEMAKAVVEEMRKQKEEEKKEAAKVIPASVVTAHPIVTVSTARKYDYMGVLKCYNTDELEQAYDDGMFVKSILKDPEAMKYMETKVQSEGTDSAGGYTVPNQLLSRILIRANVYGVVRSLVETITATSDTLWVPKRLSDVTASFTLENEDQDATDTALNKVEVIIKKLGVLVKISEELIADSVVNFIDYVVDRAAQAIAKVTDEVILTGDNSLGDGSMTGVIPATEAISLNESIVHPASDGWANIVLSDFNKVMGRLAPYAYQGRDPYWLCSNGFYHNVMNRVKGEAGGNIISTLEAGFKKQFLGYQVHTTEVFDATDEFAGDASANEADYCLFGRLDLVGAFAQRRDTTLKTTREGAAFVADQVWLKLSNRWGWVVHDQGTVDEAGSMILMTSS